MIKYISNGINEIINSVISKQFSFIPESEYSIISIDTKNTSLFKKNKKTINNFLINSHEIKSFSYN